jgi:hypothetical protein
VSTRDWLAALAKHGVDAFRAKDLDHRHGQYQAWSDSQLETYKYELAEMAGRHIPVAGCYSVREHHERYPEDATYPFARPIHWFFIALAEALAEYGFAAEEVVMFFDIKTDKKWDAAIRDEVELSNKTGLKILSYTYADDRSHPPLQMADMYVSQLRRRFRELIGKQVEKNDFARVPATVYDMVLTRNLHPDRKFRPVPTPELHNEMWDVAERQPTARRALNEITWCYFDLRNQERERGRILGVSGAQTAGS